MSQAQIVSMTKMNLLSLPNFKFPDTHVKTLREKVALWRFMLGTSQLYLRVIWGLLMLILESNNQSK